MEVLFFFIVSCFQVFSSTRHFLSYKNLPKSSSTIISSLTATETLLVELAQESCYHESYQLLHDQSMCKCININDSHKNYKA